MALDEWGHDEVLRRIGVEPSGDAFNSITFDERRNRPFNPMVNSGAIAASALIRGTGLAERRARMLAFFERFAGHPLEIDERVYRSEAATGHRNRAIAYLELNAGMIEGPVEEHLDLYFQQCSLLVTALDLATIGATLANAGVNPRTAVRALRADHVRDVLSVMNTCGMYDYAGEWQFTVGLPAKSGVGGGIMAVLPGQLGIGVFSPLLDPSGNSCRGVRVCRELSRRFRLHMLSHRGNARTVVRCSYRGSEVRSKRLRRAREAALLDRLGQQIVVYELQGNLSFANLEKLTRSVVEGLDGTAASVILDAGRLVWIDGVAYDLLARLARALDAAGSRLILAAMPSMDDPVLEAAWLAETAATVAPDVDTALEMCEDELLAAAGLGTVPPDRPVALAEVDILRELTGPELALLEAYLAFRSYRAGECIVREGDAADRLFLLTKGRAEISVSIDAAGDRRRLGTIEAGSVFGELAVFSAGRRTADVIAMTDLACFILSEEALATLGRSNPALHVKLLTLIGRSLSERLRRANAEIRALAR
jgi:glutaminase